MTYKIYHTEDNFFSHPPFSLNQALKDDAHYKRHGFKRTKIYVPGDIWIGMKS